MHKRLIEFTFSKILVTSVHFCYSYKMMSFISSCNLHFSIYWESVNIIICIVFVIYILLLKKVCLDPWLIFNWFFSYFLSCLTSFTFFILVPYQIRWPQFFSLYIDHLYFFYGLLCYMVSFAFAFFICFNTLDFMLDPKHCCWGQQFANFFHILFQYHHVCFTVLELIFCVWYGLN